MDHGAAAHVEIIYGVAASELKERILSIMERILSTKTRGRGRAGVVALTTLASLGATAIGVTVAAGPAQARCYEVGNPNSINISVGGRVVGREEPQSTETCSGNKVYYGRIKDTLTDGSCVRVRYLDAGTWSTQGTSCDSAGYRYTFTDRNNDVLSYFVGQLSESGANSQQYLNVGY